MHAIIAEHENLIVFTDSDGKVVDCFEFQRLSFTGNLKNLFREEKKDDDVRFALEEIRG
jgi:hypothetical protein